MRVVRELIDLEGELAAASAEARSAFGDGEVFAEPYVERGRHVEVQIMADAHGTVWALGTRDCSLQRRHQKVIEEAPAPGLPEALRGRLRTAAVAAARAVSYRGAGTVEFLVDPSGRAYFLEMNTRLQVEHPVTEAVFGVDLVALQLQVAEGAALPTEPPEPNGHAVEARLYAEDPATGWTPQTGVLHHLSLPDGVRLDRGYGDGDTIGVHYDAMLAKAVVHAPTRAAAVRALARALELARIHGPKTNRDLLVRSLRHPDFTSGRLDTGFYDRHLPALTEPRAGRRTRPSPPPWRTRRAAPPASVAAGATCRPSRRPSGTGTTRSATALPATASPPTASRTYAWKPPNPAAYASKSTESPGTSWSRGTATRCTSTPPSARTPSPHTPASPTPANSSPPDRCSPPCRASSSGSRTGSPKGPGSPRGSH